MSGVISRHLSGTIGQPSRPRDTMLLYGGLTLLSGVLLLLVVRRIRKSRHTITTGIAGEIPSESTNDISMLSSASVRRSLAAGAPPLPWLLRKEDKESMNALG